jgi:hypothetical protein
MKQPAFLCLLFVLLSCKTAEPSWKRGSAQESGRLHYWPEPGIEQTASEKSKEIVLFSEWLAASLFPGYDIGYVRVVFYRDHRSYAAFRPASIDSLAHFHTRTSIVHLPVNIAAEGWKHEMVHAVLYARFKDYPFWIQEGAALLLQSAKGGHPLCEATLHLPQGLHRFRSVLLEHRYALPITKDAELLRKGIYEETALAGYLAYFLWQRRMFIHTIREVVDSEQDSFLVLLGGDYERLRNFEKDFYEWLSSPLAIRPSGGC